MFKRRGFEVGAWYTASLHGLRTVTQYRGKARFSVNGRMSYANLNEFDWIGDELDIDWPEESEQCLNQ